jgi:MFS family permease
MQSPVKKRWWNRTVLAIGLASLFSDWSHEAATAVLPSFLISIGGSAALLGLIEGTADGVSSFAKLGFGWYSDRVIRKKRIAIVGYLLTAVGTAAFGFCSRVWQVLAFRVLAWFGRGMRTPVRKSLLAGATTPDAYGKAFGLERAMDTCGAIVAPLTAFWLLRIYPGNYRPIFLWSFVPGLAALFAIAFFVRESGEGSVSRFRFGESLRMLPHDFRKLLAAVGVFGLGDFSHTLLILFATQRLATAYPPIRAAQLAVSLYVFHNIIYASFSYIAGHFADRFNKAALLAGGYLIAGLTFASLIFAKAELLPMVIIFGCAGLYIAVEEALEDSLAAELLPRELIGTGFGALAFVNAIGDFLSSIIIGLLWTKIGPVCFLYSFLLAIVGAFLTFRLRSSRTG